MGHQEEKSLTQMFASETPKSDYFAFAGTNGQIMVMSQRSKTLLFDLKMNGSCEAIAFSANDKYLFSVGD